MRFGFDELRAACRGVQPPSGASFAIGVSGKKTFTSAALMCELLMFELRFLQEKSAGASHLFGVIMARRVCLERVRGFLPMRDLARRAVNMPGVYMSRIGVEKFVLSEWEECRRLRACCPRRFDSPLPAGSPGVSDVVCEKCYRNRHSFGASCASEFF
ncbi:MAG: hypothetical protein DBX55_05165 [Verrucomicrobia bacterium]|nr:MAG: hypothetical protein DBX55_05165 [Verrucomicrobiota bacterium]